jgi:small-conductance mechanosensitive channel
VGEARSDAAAGRTGLPRSDGGARIAAIGGSSDGAPSAKGVETVQSTRDHAQRLIDFRLELGQLSVSVGGLVAAAVTLLAVWLLSRSMQRAFVRHAGQREARSRAAIYTLSRLARYGLYAVGLLLAVSFLGIPTSRFAVLAGALGVGLGFGL